MSDIETQDSMYMESDWICCWRAVISGTYIYYLFSMDIRLILFLAICIFTWYVEIRHTRYLHSSFITILTSTTSTQWIAHNHTSHEPRSKPVQIRSKHVRHKLRSETPSSPVSLVSAVPWDLRMGALYLLPACARSANTDYHSNGSDGVPVSRAHSHSSIQFWNNNDPLFIGRRY